MNYYEHKIGKGTPKLAVVGAIHGDEALGPQVIELLRGVTLHRGSLSLIIAHPEALSKKVRFIHYDLNRSFPGKVNGLAERGLAYQLRQKLRNFNFVIDLHATGASISSLAIVTLLNTQTKSLLRHIPVNCVALVDKKVFGGHELASHVQNCISLEYGPYKDGRNTTRVFRDVSTILANFGIVKRPKRIFSEKQVYIVTEQFRVSKTFVPRSSLKEFKLIRRGEIVGVNGKHSVKADFDFYPLFLGRGKYDNALCLVARQKKTILC